MDSLNSGYDARSSATSGFRHLARTSLRIGSLPVYLLLKACEPVIRMLFLTLSVLGLLSTLVIGFSGAAPRFPFAMSLLVFAGLGILPLIYRAVLGALASIH